eukprot:24373-Chlamydomonas_euryale.AAC.1
MAVEEGYRRGAASGVAAAAPAKGAPPNPCQPPAASSRAHTPAAKKNLPRLHHPDATHLADVPALSACGRSTATLGPGTSTRMHAAADTAAAAAAARGLRRGTSCRHFRRRPPSRSCTQATWTQTARTQ